MTDVGIAEIFDKVSVLTEDIYTQYSEQFLSEAEKARVLQVENDPQEQILVRAIILCESKKDPFSPPLNSLQASAMHLDPQKVKRCFKQGYDVYKFITNQTKESLEPARLYKLGLFNKSTDDDIKQFDAIWDRIKTLKSENEFDDLMNGINDNIRQTLIAEKNSIIQTFYQAPIPKNNTLKQIFKRVKQNIKNQGSLALFKSTKKYQELKICGAIYNIGDDAHSWGTNLSWTLAHLRCGNNFIICTDNILNNKYRGNYNDTPCAFAREICVVLKAGYTLHVNSCADMTLHPDDLKLEHLKHLDSTGELGNGVNPSFEEIELIFTNLESKFKSSQQFTYRYNTTQITESGNLDKHRELMFTEQQGSTEVIVPQKSITNMTDEARGIKRKRSPSPK
jgi:effector-binding domain-containing protein